MSLILDALRKSDVERSRQQAPQVAGAMAAAEPPRQRRWLVPVVALLTVNAALLAWVLLRPQAEPVTRAATPPAETSAPVATSVEVATVAPARATPPPAKAVVEPLSEASAAPVSPPEPAPSVTAAAATAATAELEADPAPEPARAVPAAAAPAAIELPDARTLADNGTLAADALAMELHYYSDAADRRFAFIGGRKVSDGDGLGNGVRVEAVVRNGVVLEHRGRRYLLRRD